MAQALDAKGPPAVLGWDDSTRYINTAIQHVVLNEKDPMIVLKEAARELNKRIKKNKK